MNCFLWRVDYALDENVLTEQMWLFAAYFPVLRGRDTHIDFLPLFKCKALHCGWLRVLDCLFSSKCLLDMNNSKSVNVTFSLDPQFGPVPWTPCHGLGPWILFYFYRKVLDRVHGHSFLNNEEWIKTEIVQIYDLTRRCRPLI